MLRSRDHACLGQAFLQIKLPLGPKRLPYQKLLSIFFRKPTFLTFFNSLQLLRIHFNNKFFAGNPVFCNKKPVSKISKINTLKTLTFRLKILLIRAVNRLGRKKLVYFEFCENEIPKTSCYNCTPHSNLMFVSHCEGCTI